MNFNNVLVTLSSVLIVLSALPYMIEVVKGVAKPRVAGWFVWGTLTFIGCVAAFIDKQYPTATLLFLETLATLSIMILGWRKGDKKIDRLDTFCLVGAGVGLMLWWLFNSPSVAVVATVIIDAIGAVPTVAHSWRKPQEEVWSTFALSFSAAFLTLFAITEWRITSFAYPIYLVAINLLITMIIIFRKKLFSKTRKDFVVE